MTKSIKSYKLTLLAAILFSSCTFANNNSAIGFWHTIDDKTGKTLSVVQIWQKNNILHGTIVKIYPVLGQKVTDKCIACRDDLQNKPILGMNIIYDMQQQEDNQWSGGKVLDPKSGNVYSGKITLVDKQHLKLRGYVVFPLFGRSEVWDRTHKPKHCRYCKK